MSSTPAPDRFTPEALKGKKGAPVYLIRPADMLAKAAFRRDLAAMGANYPSAVVVLETLRDGVRHGIAPDQRTELLTLIDRADDVQSQLTEAMIAASERGEGDDDSIIADLPALTVAERADLAELERDMRIHFRPYAQLLADRRYFLDVAPILAAQTFLVGWENVPETFSQTRGVVDSALLERAVPEAHVIAIGHRAMALMRPDADAEKNFASRPGSPAGRGTSKAGSKRSTARRGTSRGKSTKKTRAT